MQRRDRWLFAAPALGLLAMLVPDALAYATVRQNVPLFPRLDHAIENVGVWQLAGFVLVGALLGGFFDRTPWLIGFAAIAALPLATIAEMFVDSTSHNLFPIEFAIYAFYGAIVALGAFATQRLR